MNKAVLTAFAASCLLAHVLPAAAGGCGDFAVPSPASYIPSGVRFHNDSHYAFRIYWADFKGNLKDYGLVQPDETAGFATYVHHRWFIEVYTPDGAHCAGPVSAPDTEECDMRISYDDFDQAIGMDGGYCDY